MIINCNTGNAPSAVPASGFLFIPALTAVEILRFRIIVSNDRRYNPFTLPPVLKNSPAFDPAVAKRTHYLILHNLRCVKFAKNWGNI